MRGSGRHCSSRGAKPPRAITLSGGKGSQRRRRLPRTGAKSQLIAGKRAILHFRFLPSLNAADEAEDLRLSLILSAACRRHRRYPPQSAASTPKLALRGDKTQRLVRPDQCDFTMQSEKEGRSRGVARGVGWGGWGRRMAEHQRVLNSRSPTPLSLSLSRHMYLARSNKIPTMMYTKSRQLHLLNLTSSHTPALSLADSSHHIGGLSARSILPNASLNSSIGLSYLFSLKHSSGQLFKFLPGLSKHFFPQLFLF